jgi:hypothetical protein
MKRFLTIQLCCDTDEVSAIRDELQNFITIFNVIIAEDVKEYAENERSCPVKITKSTSTLSCTSLIEHKDEVKLISSFLKTLNINKIERLQPEKIETLTKHTISSSLIVAAIVLIALLAKTLDQHFLDNPFQSIIIPLILASLAFGLEMLVIYRERNA